MTVASGHMYLRVDTAIECSSSSADYRLLLLCDLPLICIYQSIPIMYWRALQGNKAALNPPIEDPERAYAKRAKDQSIAHLRFLFSDFRCSQYAYEVIDMYRR